MLKPRLKAEDVKFLDDFCMMKDIRLYLLHYYVPLYVFAALGCETSCARGDTICPRPSPPPVGTQGPRAPPSRRNVAVVSHAQYFLTVTAAPASRVKAVVSKAAW